MGTIHHRRCNQKSCVEQGQNLPLLQPLVGKFPPQRQRKNSAQLGQRCQKDTSIKQLTEIILHGDPRARSKQPPLRVLSHADNQDPRPTSGDARKNQS